MLREKIDREYATTAGNDVAMISVHSPVVLLTVMPCDIADVAIIALACSTGSRPSTVLWAYNSSALPHIFLHFFIPGWVATVSTVTGTDCSSSGTSAMNRAVVVLTMLTAIAREALALLDLIYFVCVVIVTRKGHTSPLVGLASAARFGLTGGTRVPTYARTCAKDTRPVVVVAVHVCRACRFTVTERARVAIRALARRRDQIACPMITARVGDP